MMLLLQMPYTKAWAKVESYSDVAGSLGSLETRLSLGFYSVPSSEIPNKEPSWSPVLGIKLGLFEQLDAAFLARPSSADFNRLFYTLYLQYCLFQQPLLPAVALRLGLGSAYKEEGVYPSLKYEIASSWGYRILSAFASVSFLTSQGPFNKLEIEKATGLLLQLLPAKLHLVSEVLAREGKNHLKLTLQVRI